MVVPATLRRSAAPSPTRVCDSKEIRKPGGVAKSTVGSIQRSSPVDSPGMRLPMSQQIVAPTAHDEAPHVPLPEMAATGMLAMP